MDRREAIAVAATELVAEGGGHALTHRRIDRRLGWPEGTTSNYARTRRDLVRLVVDRVTAVPAPRPEPGHLPATVAEAVDQVVQALDGTVARGVDTRARMALALDCRDDAELHELLTTGSPVRASLLADAAAMLRRLGVAEPAARAVDLIGILDGLRYDRLVGAGSRGAPVDAAAVLTAWLVGLGARQDEPSGFVRQARPR